MGQTAVKRRNVSGLGNALAGRKKVTKPELGKRFNRKVWRAWRLSYFQRTVRLAALAKAHRLALGDVTQWMIGEYYGVSASTVCQWESGHYGWQGDMAEVIEYNEACTRLSNNV